MSDRDWVQVPLDPTEAMVVAGFESAAWDALGDAVIEAKAWPYSCRESAECVTGIYRAMLAGLATTKNPQAIDSKSIVGEPAGSKGLPELPYSPYLVFEWRSATERVSWTAYTAEQLRAFGRTALSQHSQADQRVIDWLLSGDTGTSSELICRVLSSSTAPISWHDQHLPMDGSDFGRCHRLLKKIPEWRVRLPEIAAHFPMWGPLITAWDEITALYEVYEATSPLPQRARHTAYAPLGTRLYQLEQAGYLAAGWIKTGPGCWRRPEEPAVA